MGKIYCFTAILNDRNFHYQWPYIAKLPCLCTGRCYSIRPLKFKCADNSLRTTKSIQWSLRSLRYVWYACNLEDFKWKCESTHSQILWKVWYLKQILGEQSYSSNLFPFHYCRGWDKHDLYLNNSELRNS